MGTRFQLSKPVKIVCFIALLSLIFQCYWIRPSDPNFRLKPLANEEFTGFISRDFFQLVVKVDADVKESPIRDKRLDCKRRSIPLRNRATIPLLIQEVKDAENDRLRGINKIRYAYPRAGSAGDTAGAASFDPSGSNTPIAMPLFPPAQQPNPATTGGVAGANPGGSPNQMQGQQGQNNQQNRQGAEGTGDEKDGSKPLFEQNPKHGILLFDKEMEYLQGEFAWFLDSYQLYKEDYSDPKECVFIYRVAKKGLYERIEKTNLSVNWEDYE